ncbi:SRPBCC family protein [Novosphingobium humi]|uniref:SRPBCC family protein n=1 Tax=Novosphingobium humi TaxID=2282397 RepID=A0ABY7U2G3_9SPHN|nr:SRPBCC family protein [Novosphingobium humi]WCT79506.1 SRPBCC family protein [Novosphingobium humi]WJT00502.1 SRPBCC family protein [Novosphingobium humi]
MMKAYAMWMAAGMAVLGAPAMAETPAYQTIHLEQDVARPAAQVWARIGRFCDIGEWLHVPCRLVAGKDGEVGAVRDLNNGRMIEVIVGRTDLSYAYAMPDGMLEGQGFYHGNLAVVPVTKSTSRIVYSILYLDKGAGDEAGIRERREKREQRFGEALKTMKALSEAKPR